MQLLGRLVLAALVTAGSGQVEKIGSYWSSFENKTINAATTEEEFLYEITDELFNYDSFEPYLDGNSFGLELWWIAFSRLGINFRVVTPPAAGNALSAVVQMVLNGDAQLSMVPTVYVPEETKGLVITQPTHSTRYKLFVQSPTRVSTSLSLGKVFTPVLWLAIVVSMLLLGVILIFIELLGQRARIRSYLATPADFGQIVLTIVGCFCFQGATQVASGCSGRVLVFTSLVCGYLVYVSYNTLVISQLTTVSFKPPFDSLQEMAEQGTHKLLVRNQTALLDDIKITRFKDGQRGILADVWDKLLPLKPKADNLYNQRSAVARLCKENIALLDSELEINAATQQRWKCNAISLKDSYFRSNLGFVLNKDNPFNHDLIRLFNRMRETGIINRMRRYLDQPEVGPLQPLPSLNPIELDSLVPMLVVLYTGMFLSLVTLGLEIAIVRGGDQLRERLAESGFYTWTDLFCFWRTIKRQRDLREMEDAVSESSDESDGGGARVKFSRSTRKLETIKKLTRNSRSEQVSKRTGSNADQSIPRPTRPKVASQVHVINDNVHKVAQETGALEGPRRAVLRRQNRYADLTTVMSREALVSLTPVDEEAHDPVSSHRSKDTFSVVAADANERPPSNQSPLRMLEVPRRTVERRHSPRTDHKSPDASVAPPLPPRKGRPTELSPPRRLRAPEPSRADAFLSGQPGGEESPSAPDERRVRPPLLYRNLVLSLDSGGFMDLHSILNSKHAT